MSAFPKEKKGATFTILIAEDNEMDVFFLRRAYQMAGLPHALQVVQDGEQAIDYLQGNPPYHNRQQFPPPDLLLLDIKMPRRDGFDVLRWMQGAGMDKLPVLVLSSSNLEEDKSKAMQLGARDYYVKTGDIAASAKFLKEICQRWLKDGD